MQLGDHFVVTQRDTHAAGGIAEQEAKAPVWQPRAVALDRVQRHELRFVLGRGGGRLARILYRFVVH